MELRFAPLKLKHVTLRALLWELRLFWSVNVTACLAVGHNLHPSQWREWESLRGKQSGGADLALAGLTVQNSRRTPVS